MSRYELVEMQSVRFSYFPRTFTWRGKTIEVTDVVKCWTQQRGRTINRHYFQVRLSDGIERTLYQDLIDHTWHVTTDDSRGS